MKLSEAGQILGLNGHVTESDVIKAYRQLAKKYHPDINPLGLEMMQMLNAAYEALRGFSGEIPSDTTKAGQTINNSEYLEKVFEALSKIKDLEGLNIEICGVWAWVSGDTQRHKSQLKEACFKWSPKKTMWYFAPDAERKKYKGTAKMDDIRLKYGSAKPVFNQYQAIN